MRTYRSSLEDQGLSIDQWACEQVEMRLGFARRFRRVLKRIKPELEQLGVQWVPWMEKVTLYYYYPEKLAKDPSWVRELGEILVACEQLEAYSNRQRGKDYYTRSQESFREAFRYLDTLKRKGQLSHKVVTAVRALTAQGTFDSILKAARGGALSSSDKCYLRTLSPIPKLCRS